MKKIALSMLALGFISTASLADGMGHVPKKTKRVDNAQFSASYDTGKLTAYQRLLRISRQNDQGGRH